MRSVAKQLSGWGRYPQVECRVYRPERVRDVAGALFEGEPDLLPRGLGRSYGDNAVNDGGGIVSMVRMNRMLDFDAHDGILTCEGGVSLAEIIEAFLPRGWFLPVTPGTRFVTVGGAIANDVHGKNHHCDGTFSNFLLDVELVTAGGETLHCSREQNSDVFWATVGGAGLTGIILSARLRLRKVESAYVRADYRRLPNIDALLAALEDGDGSATYSVAWVDCLARGRHLGRSVLMLGEHAARDEAAPHAKDPLAPPRKGRRNVPFNFPALALNPLSVGAFNAFYYRFSRAGEGQIVPCDAFFYPLDAFENWNRVYGSRGFTQYQLTLPPSETGAMVTVLERLSTSRRASFLAVLKRLGPQGQGMLSYPFEGFTLTLDIPMRNDLVPFLRELDTVLLDHGGRLYLAKDVCATPEAFAAMYPRLDEFRAVQQRLDPNGRIASTQARRLRIVEDRRHGG